MTENANYYHVRINPKRQNPSADFTIFMNEMNITNEAKWDKDHNGKMKVGDFIGFILGNAGEEIVHIFKVKSELPLNKREPWWVGKTPYTVSNGVNTKKHRVPITLTSEHELAKTWDWSDIKQKVGLSPNCQTWMPRSTQLVVKKHLLPFVVGGKLIKQNGLELINSLYSD